MTPQPGAAEPAPAPAARWRLGIAGLGNVGSGLLRILRDSRADLAQRYGVDFAVTAVAELGGGAFHPDGLNLDTVLDALDAGQPVAGLPAVGFPGATSIDLLERARPDILLEATPVNLDDGEPGLSTVTRALELWVHVVLANKAPLALAYRRLSALSDLPVEHRARPAIAALGPRMRFSACVGGALPVINVGRRDLAGCRITRFEGVLNGTSQSILRAIEAGRTYQEALADAQRRGIAEADPALDVGGGDAACKLVIVANAVLNLQTELADVRIRGVDDMPAEAITAAARNGRRIVLLCLADRTPDGYRLSVEPTSLPLSHPLARLSPDEMGAVFYTETIDRLALASSEPGALPASAAMLRDVLEIVRCESSRESM
jgi:homoserine dehydrogenase